MPPRSKRSAAVEEAAPEPAPRRSSRRLGSLPGRRTSARRRKSRCSPRHHEAPARFATGEFVVGVEAQQANPKAKAETKQAGATHAHTAHTHTRARVYERACTERCMHGHTDDSPTSLPVRHPLAHTPTPTDQPRTHTHGPATCDRCHGASASCTSNPRTGNWEKVSPRLSVAPRYVCLGDGADSQPLPHRSQVTAEISRDPSPPILPSSRHYCVPVHVDRATFRMSARACVSRGEVSDLQ
jgi:hypothetical protein